MVWYGMVWWVVVIVEVVEVVVRRSRGPKLGVLRYHSHTGVPCVPWVPSLLVPKNPFSERNRTFYAAFFPGASASVRGGVLQVSQATQTRRRANSRALSDSQTQRRHRQNKQSRRSAKGRKDRVAVNVRMSGLLNMACAGSQARDGMCSPRNDPK
jgi:hypothetical protein